MHVYHFLQQFTDLCLVFMILWFAVFLPSETEQLDNLAFKTQSHHFFILCHSDMSSGNTNR